ncbi:MAG: alpha/beta hydrolase [Acetatifactor sp.]|jgi:acetyl esterase/lipase|nr:alpha/beta hydrolase [Acetatifactor sp.]
MPSEEARALNEMFKNMPKGDGGYLKEREEGKNRPKPPLPKGVTLKELNLRGNYAELIEKPGNTGLLIMYIHGGGFQTGAAQERREITFEIVDKYGSNVVANNYRLAPENKWPAALEDCVAAYEALLGKGYAPWKIVLAGESAGGSLVLASLLYMRDHNIPLPRAAVVYSCSITHTTLHLPSHTENAKTDYMLGDAVASNDLEHLFGNGPDAEERSRHPYISPYFADFRGLPPTFIAVSDSEALYDDSRVLYEKMKQAGVRAELHVGHDLIHAYPIFPNLPESVETMKKTFEFLDTV